jgi:hypothetical protein
MKFIGTVACCIVAWDCAEKAVGIQHQELFSTDAIWVWWVVAFFWTLNAIRFILAND